MLSYEDFSPLTFEDRDLISDHLKKYPQVHSDMLFSTMFIWSHYSRYSYAFVRESLVLSTDIGGEISFRVPAGPEDPLLLAEVCSLAAEKGGEIPLYAFDLQGKKALETFWPGLPLKEDSAFADYVYRSSDLSELKGKNYLSIRRHINKFRRNCPYEMEMIAQENLHEVVEFLDRWCSWKRCEEHPLLSHERTAVLIAIARFFEMGLEGLFLRVDDEISALEIWEELNHDTAVIHFEKGLPECEGNYKAVNQEAARILREKYTWINRESDLGLPGLREAKMRYHPDHCAKVWYATRGDLEERGP